jgi:CRISPR-associated endonuclease Csn1
MDMKDYVLNKERDISSNNNDIVWAFDLGKGSIGEAVRRGTEFLHKESLLIPAELARRGPATSSGSPASRYRMLQTRRAHERREHWLDIVWEAAGLKPLISRTVELVDYEVRKVKKTVRGKTCWKTKKVGGHWVLKHEADKLLEKEFGSQNDSTCYTSCLLRIKLLKDDKLETWQLYKALFSAIQKRGYAKVPWEKEQKVSDTNDKNAQEEAENIVAGKRWSDFAQHSEVAKLGDAYKRACYFDAWHMKLWNPANPKHVELHSSERPESTQKVVFPGRVIAEEVLCLAENAAKQEPRLNEAFDKIMEGWRGNVKRRFARVNAHRVRLGKQPIHEPDFSLGARNFAELLAFGPGGSPKTGKEGVRNIPSHDAATRRATGLRPGGSDDAMGALNQEVARFDNRLRSPCALIPRLTVCRNLAPEEIPAIKKDDHEKLLPAQVTLLMKLKDMRVEEREAKRKQRGLTADELREIFEKLNPQRKYHLTKREWRTWCGHLNLLPVTDPDEKNAAKKSDANAEVSEKKKPDELAVERPRAAGRARFSRPALRLLKELLLSGLAPDAFHTKLIERNDELLNKLNLDVLDKEPVITKKDAGGNDYITYIKRPRPWVLVSDLDFLLRMNKEDKTADSWDTLRIPTQQLDRLAQESDASVKEREVAIRTLIGQQNNPIVRHRLETFWKRLQKLEAKFGEPRRIVLEFIRDDSESSWLGADAIGEITKAQKEQRERRENARKMLTDMGQPNGDVLKYLLWEAQGGQCLYGVDGKVKEEKLNPATGESFARCLYIDTALPFTSLNKYRIDHIVPRAKGGPNSFSNLILTTDEANAAKGDRTPWQWFRQDRSLAEWDAYKERVLRRFKDLGGKKVRLLLSADAEKLVERYTPLAETAWIARLAQTVASLHFGWANGNDSEGKKRVTTVSGGLTGRTRKKYFLNSLLGRNRELDKSISEKLTALAELKASALTKEEQKAKARLLRAELDELNSEAEAKKQRDDDRHHALDAMVLSFLEGWVNDPNREDEFRFTLLGDNRPYSPQLKTEIGQLRQRIIAYESTLGKAASADDRARINQQIIACRDALASMRMGRNALVVREAFRREIDGDEKKGVKPILPLWLHYPKPELKAAFHRGVWLRVESESRAARATVDDFATAFEQERIALADLPYLENHVTEEIEFSVAHGLRRMAEIVPHKDYDSKAVDLCVEEFFKTNPTESQWKEWCASSAAPTGIKPKKGQEDKREFVFYKIQEMRTKRPQETPSSKASLYSIGIGSNEVPEFDRTHFETQIARLVCRPERGADKPGIPLQADTELQNKLRALLPRIEEFYRQYPADPGDRPRKESALAAWQMRKDNAAKAWEEFIKEIGLDKNKRVYFSTDSASVTDRRYEPAGISSVLLHRVKRFDRAKAEKQVQSITDTWTRFQLREFLKRDPAPVQWKEFCANFVQVSRPTFKDFLAGEPQTAEDFVNFYKKQASDPKSKAHTLIKAVHQFIGGASDYVDLSKDGSGIYAKGGNRGYLLWKQVEESGENAGQVSYGAKPVRAFLKLAEVKRQLLSKKGVVLLDDKLWRTKMLLHLPNDTQSGKKLVPAGYYYFGSISNGTYATLNPLAGGDVYDGISIALLLAQGLRRKELETI